MWSDFRNCFAFIDVQPLTFLNIFKHVLLCSVELVISKIVVYFRFCFGLRLSYVVRYRIFGLRCHVCLPEKVTFFIYFRIMDCKFSLCTDIQMIATWYACKGRILYLMSIFVNIVFLFPMLCSLHRSNFIMYVRFLLLQYMFAFTSSSFLGVSRILWFLEFWVVTSGIFLRSLLRLSSVWVVFYF